MGKCSGAKIRVIAPPMQASDDSSCSAFHPFPVCSIVRRDMRGMIRGLHPNGH